MKRSAPSLLFQVADRQGCSGWCRKVFENSPFLISAEEAGITEDKKYGSVPTRLQMFLLLADVLSPAPSLFTWMLPYHRFAVSLPNYCRSEFLRMGLLSLVYCIIDLVSESIVGVDA